MKSYSLCNNFGINRLLINETEPQKPKNNQVLLKIKAVALNYRDLLMIEGTYNPKQKLPLIPVSDGVGEVLEKGCDVKDLKIGDRVVGLFSQTWMSGEIKKEHMLSVLGGPLNGMLSEFIVLNESGVIKVPNFLTDIEASTLPCAALTAWRAVVEEGNISSESVVVLQGTGGVSLFALQFLESLKARVIMISGNDLKIEKIKKRFNFLDIINYNSTPKWAKKIKDITNGKGADLIVELGGALTFQESLEAIGVGGQIKVIGNLSGNRSELNLVTIPMKSIKIQGIFVGNRASFNRMNDKIDSNKMHPFIDAVFSFNEAKEAFMYLKKSEHLGKVCIKL